MEQNQLLNFPILVDFVNWSQHIWGRIVVSASYLVFLYMVLLVLKAILTLNLKALATSKDQNSINSVFKTDLMLVSRLVYFLSLCMILVVSFNWSEFSNS